MTSDAERIEDEIRNTRARIDMKMNELENKLSPSGFLNAALGDGNEQVADLGNAMVKKAKENPVSALLIGAGLAGLYLASRSQSAKGGNDETTEFAAEPIAQPKPTDPAERIAQNAESIRNELNELRDSVAQSVEEFSAAASKGSDAARESVHNASERVRQASDRVAEYANSATRALGDVPDHAREIGRTVTDTVRSGVDSAGHFASKQARVTRHRADSAAEWVRENPVSAGLVALAVGAAAASIFTARKPSASVEASRKLHSAAREREGYDEPKGRERFENFQKAAESQATKSAPRKGPVTKSEKGPKSASVKSSAKPLKNGPAYKKAPTVKTAASTKTVEPEKTDRA
ncbi:hypothetical protein K1W69_05705 [Hoeflea sp. WL0058]|uniref:DUF3618 domain-containing protein n=1 Tax=Flavimaribacter sediminis TaxID=2865987 RepID=A0AAE3CYU8_9HYPH|nr:hypothetical protein [Flavimaribacter sediminis]MBW8636680.1 hypothetical protein [Flavimaribacter sediminis]